MILIITMGSMTISVKDHSKNLFDKLTTLRSETNLLDLDLLCEDVQFHVHKVVMAASSDFFQEQLCNSTTARAQVILKLEDFNLKLKSEAVSFLLDFIYKGEVVIPANLLSSVCEAAHELGVFGLIDFLPAPAKKVSPPRLQESSTQIDDESFAANNCNSNSGEGSNNDSMSVNTIPQNQVSQSQTILQWPNSAPASDCHVSQIVGQDVFHQTNEIPGYSGNNQCKPFYGGNYAQEPNFVSHETTIVDLDSNSLDGTQAQHEGHENSQQMQQQPKGRLRIINQAENLMTENIHDLKSSSQGAQQANLETHQFLNWMFDQQQQQTSNNFDWYSQQPSFNNYAPEEGSSWTTPAATNTASSTWPSPVETANPSQASSSAGPTMLSASAGAAGEKNSSLGEGQDSNSLKLRPPPPLLAKGSKLNCKRPELEVRKDLTLPTAPTAIEDNVFQADEDLPQVFNIDEEDDDEEDVNNDGRLEKAGGSQEKPNSSSASSDSANPSAMSSFKCFQCSMSFKSDDQLRSHTRHAHKDETTLLFCPVCKTTVFQGLENLKVHLYKSHGIGEVFRCEDCDYETSMKSSYAKHLNSAHAGDTAKKLRICQKCGKAFKSRVGLKLHLQTHQEEGSVLHQCGFCEFRTPQKVNLIKHLAVKHKKDEHGQELKMNKACPLCPFKCVADHTLKAHMLRKHTAKEKMKHRCTQCDYATVEAAALKRHVRFKHTNERPFMCSTCGFSTHTHSAMARHKRGHAQAKPFVCSTCGMAYADRKRLRDHQVIHSSTNVPLPFDCDFCGYSTRRKDNLQAHIKRLHPDLASKKQKPLQHSSHIVGHVNEDGSIRPIHNETE